MVIFKFPCIKETSPRRLDLPRTQVLHFLREILARRKGSWESRFCEVFLWCLAISVKPFRRPSLSCQKAQKRLGTRQQQEDIK